MSGDLHAHDSLCVALEAYEAAPFPAAGWQTRFGPVALWAFRCGKPEGVPTLPWAVRRRETYRSIVSGAVSHLNGVIASLEASAITGQVKS